MPAPRHAIVPALDTTRLMLRGHTPADLAECAAMWADPLVTRHIGGRPLSEEEVWARVLRYAGLWALLGFGYWVVRERTSGRFVGEVGLADFRRELMPSVTSSPTPSVDGVPEVGWVLGTWAHGHGFATEAVGAALAWADAQPADAQVTDAHAQDASLAARRTVCLIAPANVASVRVAERCGYRPAGSAAYRGATTLVFERRAPAPGRPAAGPTR